MKPTLPGCERSKTSASFWMTWDVALVMLFELISSLKRDRSCNVLKAVNERVNLGARVCLGDADQKIVRALGGVTREREAARDVALGGEAAQ